MKKLLILLCVAWFTLSLAVPTFAQSSVVLLDGTYTGAAFQAILDASADGTTFRPKDNAVVTVIGDAPLNNWTDCTVNGVHCLKTSADGRRITALFRDTTPLTNARLPEQGYFYVSSVNTDDSLWTEETTKWKDGTLGQHSFNASENDLPERIRNAFDVTVHIPHMWHDEVTALADYNPESGRVSMVKYAAMTIKPGDRYCLENVLNALDKPGEWCFDSKADCIYYVPFENETADNLRLSASSTVELLRIAERKNLTFERIVFRNTGWEYANADNISGFQMDWTKGIDMDQPQGAIDVAGALTVLQSENIVFRNCEFLNLGATAVRFLSGCTNCSADSCRFDRIGAGAVYAGGPNNMEACAHAVTVRNCTIAHYGLQFHSAPGVLYTFVDGGTIEHNEIHDGFYTGISCGWVWLYGAHVTNHIKIRNNLIYNIGQRMLSDMGGIYLLGTQYGTEISGNVIHDVHCYEGQNGYAGTGIYTDAGASQMQIFNNLVFNCSTCGFNATLATDNCICNNIAAFCGRSIVDAGGTLGQYESHLTYRNNIFLTTQSVPIYCHLNNPEHLEADGNLLWDLTNGSTLFFALHGEDKNYLLRQQVTKKGYFKNTVFADPMFRDAEHFDFALSSDSPALSMGFVPWDYDNAGTLTDTSVGLSESGGQTPYNSPIDQCTLHPANLSLGEKIRVRLFALWDCIVAWFSNQKGFQQ